MADIEIEEILRKPEDYVTEGEPVVEIENLVTSTLTKILSEDDARIVKEAEKVAQMNAEKQIRTEEQVADEYLQMAADMDNFYVDDLDMISTHEVAELLEEKSTEEAENVTNMVQANEDAGETTQEYVETGSNKSNRVFVGLELEESLLNEEVVELDVNRDENEVEEDITVSDGDMKNAHYIKLTANEVVERRHDVDLNTENTLRAEAMKEAEIEMENLEKETKAAERKAETKEKMLWAKSLDRVIDKVEKKDAEKNDVASDGTSNIDSTSKNGSTSKNDSASNNDGNGEAHRTEFVSATIEKLCYEMEDGVVWRKTLTKKRIRKKIFSLDDFEDDEYLY